MHTVRFDIDYGNMETKMDNNDTPNRFAANPYADFIGELPPPQKNNKKKFLVIGIIITVLLIIVGLVAALAVNKEPTPAINVPEGWKNVETEAGISVIMPLDWEAQPKEIENQGTLVSTLVGIGPLAQGFKVGNTTLSEDSDIPVFAFISVGVAKRTDQAGQAAFEQLLTDKDALPQEFYEEQGISKDEFILSSSKQVIDDIEWLAVTSENGGQYSRSLYRWIGDQAVTIRLVSDSKEKLEADFNGFILPIAASSIKL